MLSSLIFSGWASVALSSENKSNHMFLGDWKSQISNQIMPNFFENIRNDSTELSYRFNSTSLLGLSSLNYDRSWLAESILLNKSAINFLNRASNLSFSFHSESITADDLTLSKLQVQSGFKSNNSAYYPNPELINQELYAPGYTFSHGFGSLGLSAVFVQQNFLDNKFGYLTLESQNNSLSYDDRVLYETSRGLGYQLNFDQQILNSQLGFDYQSKIEMNEFDTFGKTYSQAGDYDIPENFSVYLDMPAFKSQTIRLKAQKINYSDINAVINSGFSERFLALMNSPVRPVFEWDDLTVYSVWFNKSVSESLAWNVEIFSRQQALTQSNTLDTILKDDTAPVSYKFAIQNTILNHSNLEFFVSYADKPIFVGRTDFGRFLTNNLDKHIEAGLSWKREF